MQSFVSVKSYQLNNKYIGKKIVLRKDVTIHFDNYKLSLIKGTEFIIVDMGKTSVKVQSDNINNGEPFWSYIYLFKYSK